MSEFSRETLLNIIETDHVQCGEASALARMALAAMDSEPVEMPLDYLQGHKDGLEWAAQLAEANHPETGDWLYDDPIELAKAIRKGPDMPPAQPAADSEPVAIIDQANLDYLRSGADADVWPPEREEMGDVLLYRHAQPAPVSVPDEIQKLKDGRGFKYVKDGVHYSVNYANGWNQCRVAMLASAPQSPGSEPATVPGKWIPVSERLPEDSGRYWCYVEEQNDLGKSHYQWNCSWNGDRWWVESEGGGIVTHWMPLPAAPKEVKGE
ncbi:DUF551 domain-containing protein [Klebsiella pneumoniae]|nr:DUF551 domain-containing protein [Klebsiella pneumoniae]MCB6158141.1 DUF551 domain-containing protein [Klebsiella pneumoniae]